MDEVLSERESGREKGRETDCETAGWRFGMAKIKPDSRFVNSPRNSGELPRYAFT